MCGLVTDLISLRRRAGFPLIAEMFIPLVNADIAWARVPHIGPTMPQRNIPVTTFSD
ncbi:hypothetical protein [Nitrosomonas sp. Is37]|uniref:hypothetical protein n=1 Tax=Nitrosomonas sp. Is37 TaxID=3080535 RepID=UPI00294B5199|nr:hypothetical protein [Nitrosomonas sp. Is37]MDV6343186.1 hypothetical protein [Nitrosomonas sp. Is37]